MEAAPRNAILMNVAALVWLVACVAGIALSLKSVAVLRSPSAWTIAGWVFTALYCAIAAYDVARSRPAPAHVDYVTLALLTICFIVAGRRDEPQAEPWWWPRGAGPTGAQRRAAAAASEER
jgi:hypothetical protein